MTFPNNDYEPVMRPIRTAIFFAPVQGCAEEMRIWLSTGAVDVVILEVIAHFERIRRLQSRRTNPGPQFGIKVQLIREIQEGEMEKERGESSVVKTVSNDMI